MIRGRIKGDARKTELLKNVNNARRMQEVHGSQFHVYANAPALFAGDEGSGW